MHLNIYPFLSACFLLRSFLEQACACGCRLLYLMAVPCRCAIYSLLCSVVTDLCYKFLNLLHTLYLPFFFLSLPTLLQRLQFQYTQCQQSHMISKEMPAKSQSLKREIRFVCSAFLHCGQWLIGMCNRTEYRKYTQICGEHNPKHEWYFRICFHVP